MELRNCRFCNSPHVAVRYMFQNKSYAIKCDTCKICVTFDDWNGTKEQLIKIWNEGYDAPTQ